MTHAKTRNEVIESFESEWLEGMTWDSRTEEYVGKNSLYSEGQDGVEIDEAGLAHLSGDAYAEMRQDYLRQMGF